MLLTAEDPTAAGQPDYGPSLPELLRPRLRALGPTQRVLLALLALAVVAGVAVAVVRTEAANRTYTQSESDARERGLEPIEFNFDHSSKLDVSKPRGFYVVAERRTEGTLAARFAVSELSLEPRPGLLSGYLPIVATDLQRAAARRYDNFRLAFEGRARVNEVEGYQFAFTARVPRKGLPPRQLFGRIVMLPEPYDYEDPEAPYPEGEGPRRGLLVTMLATTLDPVPSATRVGDEGILQRPFRSFRFGA